MCVRLFPQFSEWTDDEDDPRLWFEPNPLVFPPLVGPIKEKPSDDSDGFEFTQDDLLKRMHPNLMPSDPRQPPLINHHPPVPVLINHLPPPSHFASAANAQQPFNMKIVKREINNATLINDEDDEYAQQRRRLVWSSYNIFET